MTLQVPTNTKAKDLEEQNIFNQKIQQQHWLKGIKNQRHDKRETRQDCVWLEPVPHVHKQYDLS